MKKLPTLSDGKKMKLFTKPFYSFRLSNGAKVKLTEQEYCRHLNDAMSATKNRPVAIHRSESDRLVRNHIEFGGHLEKKGK